MDIRFKWIGGATFIIYIDNLKIAVDPVLCKKGTVQDYFWFKSKRIEDPQYDDADFNDIDLWLITHEHEDHLDKIGLSKIESNSTIISNKKAGDILKKGGKRNVFLLGWRNTLEIKHGDYIIKIEAIKAIHGINPISAFFAGKGNGYYVSVLKGTESFSFYITGDTVYKSSIIKQLNGRPIDLLIPNMGAAKQGSWLMTLTLNAKMLQKLMKKLKPITVIPVHYGTFMHYNESIKEIIELKNNAILILELGKARKISPVTL